MEGSASITLTAKSFFCNEWMKWVRTFVGMPDAIGTWWKSVEDAVMNSCLYDHDVCDPKSYASRNLEPRDMKEGLGVGFWSGLASFSERHSTGAHNVNISFIERIPT